MTWQEQWRAVMGGLLALGRCYSGQQSATEMTQIAMLFFHDSYLLENCLQSDEALTPAVRQSVPGHVAESPFITLAGAMDNPGRVGQTILRTVSEERPPRLKLRIEWHAPDGALRSEDAFDIAVGAVAEWRSFMSRHGLSV